MAYNQAVGVNSIGYLKIQAARGTAETTATTASGGVALDFVSLSVKPRIGVTSDPSIGGRSSEQAVSALSIGWGGTLKVRGNLQGAAMAKLLGGVVGTDGLVSLTHTITEAVSSPWFTLWYDRGGVDTGNVERLHDLKFTGFTFNIAAGSGAEAYGTFDFDFVAGTYTNTIPTSGLGTLPTLPVSAPMLYTLIDGATLCDGINTGNATLAWRPTRLGISYKIPFETDLPYFTTTAVESPLRNGLAVCEWDWEERLGDMTLINAAKTGALNTGGALNCKLVSGGYTLTFTTTSARCIDYDGGIDGYGSMRQSVKWRGQYHATDTGSLKIVHVSTV
jgi:hypothetical protein